VNRLSQKARTYPWVLTALASVPVLYGVPLWLDLLVLFLIALLVLFSRGDLSGRLRWLGFLGLAAVLALCFSRPATDAPSYPFEPGEILAGRGVVVTEAPLSRGGDYRVSLRLESVASAKLSGDCRAVVRVRGLRGTSPALGQSWEWTGQISAEVLTWRSGHPVGFESSWSRARWEAREAVFAVFRQLDAPSSALAEALLLGAVDDLTSQEKASFREAGCSHVLALSGMHLSLLAALLALGLRARVHPGLGFCLTQVLISAFCVLAGPIPSLYRAWMMTVVEGAERLRQHHPEPLEVLAQSFLITVLLWPTMATTLSLQLSFLSMAGLFHWSKPWEWTLRPWLGRFGGATLASSLAALVATLPLTVGLFGEVRWVGIFLSAPLVALTTVYLFASGVFLLLGLCLPGLPLNLLAPGFRLLYDLIFAVTGWGSHWPALGGLWAALGLALLALGRAGVFLYNNHIKGGSVPVSLHYDSPTHLQAFLDDHGFNALKRWGQNFLINPGARLRILEALELKPAEPVWEIGPGLGALTHHLVEAGHPLTVFEIDPGYSGFLRAEFSSAAAGFQLHEGDVIKTWRSALGASPRQRGIKCVGNLPYNAASAIIADFVEGGYFPEVLVVTVQKEMADRMVATVGTKNYSSFSVLCQSVFALTDVMVLKPGSFYPAPEVTSRVVKLVPHDLYPGLNQKRFSVLVRECFSSRRKTLRNNLAGAAAALRVSEDALKNAFLSQGIDLARRAETLTIEEFVRVYSSLNPAAKEGL